MHELVESDPRWRAATQRLAKAEQTLARYTRAEEAARRKTEQEREYARRRFADGEAGLDELVPPYAPKDPDMARDLTLARIAAHGGLQVALAQIAPDVLPKLAGPERELLAVAKEAAETLRDLV